MIDYSQKLENDYPNETAYWHLQKLRNEMQRVEILTLQNVSFSEERAEVCKCGSKNMFVDEGKLYCSDCRKLADVHLQT